MNGCLCIPNLGDLFMTVKGGQYRLIMVNHGDSEDSSKEI